MLPSHSEIFKGNTSETLQPQTHAGLMVPDLCLFQLHCLSWRWSQNKWQSDCTRLHTFNDVFCTQHSGYSSLLLPPPSPLPHSHGPALTHINSHRGDKDGACCALRPQDGQREDWGPVRACCPWCLQERGGLCWRSELACIIWWAHRSCCVDQTPCAWKYYPERHTRAHTHTLTQTHRHTHTHTHTVTQTYTHTQDRHTQ